MLVKFDKHNIVETTAILYITILKEYDDEIVIKIRFKNDSDCLDIKVRDMKNGEKIIDDFLKVLHTCAINSNMVDTPISTNCTLPVNSQQIFATSKAAASLEKIKLFTKENKV